MIGIWEKHLFCFRSNYSSNISLASTQKPINSFFLESIVNWMTSLRWLIILMRNLLKRSFQLSPVSSKRIWRFTILKTIKSRSCCTDRDLITPGLVKRLLAMLMMIISPFFVLKRTKRKAITPWSTLKLYLIWPNICNSQLIANQVLRLSMPKKSSLLKNIIRQFNSSSSHVLPKPM